QPDDPERKSINTIRDTLVAAGYFEAVTFSFVSDALAEDFKPADAAGLPRASAAVRKADARLRPSILPGLLEAVARNENNGNAGAKLYEIGSTFWTDAGGAIQERRRVGLVGSPDVREVRGVGEAVRYEQIASIVGTVKPEHLEAAEYVTTYRGKPLEKGQKSVTLKLVFRAADRTLTGDEVEGAVKRLVDAATAQLGAILRA